MKQFEKAQGAGWAQGGRWVPVSTPPPPTHTRHKHTRRTHGAASRNGTENKLFLTLRRRRFEALRFRVHGPRDCVQKVFVLGLCAPPPRCTVPQGGTFRANLKPIWDQFFGGKGLKVNLSCPRCPTEERTLAERANLELILGQCVTWCGRQW